jgi:oligoendopeptidase F
MELFRPAEATAAPALRERDAIPERFKWNLENIFPSWDAWDVAYQNLDRKIDAFGALQGTLAASSTGLLAALKSCAMK